MSSVSVIIVGTGYNAHGLARSLRCKEVNVYGLADEKKDILCRSRLFKFRECTERFTGWDGKRQAFDRLIQKINHDNPNATIVVFPTDEPWTLELLHNKQHYESKGVIVPFGNTSSALLCLDKSRFRRWCVRQKVLSPKTVTYGDPKDWTRFHDESLEMSFPLVVKPTSKACILDDIGFNYYKLFSSRQDFSGWIEHFASKPPSTPMIAEEFIDGPVENLVSLQGYVDKRGDLSVSQYRKLVQTEGLIGCGNLVLIEAVEDRLLVLTKEILSKMQHHGFFDIEFKLSLNDHCPIVIEINPRPCMINYAATMMGANLPVHAIRDLTGIELICPTTAKMEPNWIWSRNLPHFFTCIRNQNWKHISSAGPSFAKAWLGPYAGRKSVDPTQTMSDPLVTIELLTLYLHKVFGRIISRQRNDDYSQNQEKLRIAQAELIPTVPMSPAEKKWRKTA